MPALDRVPFTLNEQFASSDLNEVQNITQRYLHDLAVFPAEVMPLAENSGLPALDWALDTVVLGGLGISPIGATAHILPGLLVTSRASAPDEPVLSAGVLCVLDTEQEVALPSPLADTWYLLVATAALVDDATVSRRIWNVSDRAWDSTNVVKRARATMTFTLIAGSATDLPISFDPATQIPLYGIFRPAGGGDLLSSHVVDLRPLRPSRPVHNTAGVELLQNEWRVGDALLRRLNVHVRHDDEELHAVGQDLNPIHFKDPSVGSPVADEWWYLYLAPVRAFGGRGVCPRHAQTALLGLRQQGVLVFSTTPPTGADAMSPGPATRVNSAALQAPAPFSETLIPAGEAVCFGALRRNSGNSSWVGAQCDGDHVTLYREASLITVTTTDLDFSPKAPVGARAADLGLYVSPSSTGYLEIRPSYSVTTAFFELGLIAPHSTEGTYFELSQVPLASDPELHVVKLTPLVAAVGISVTLRGYRF